jgi:hypothetical protein
VDLGTLRATGVSERAFFRRVELLGTAPASLYFGLDGPVPESLGAEFEPAVGAPEPPRNLVPQVG